MKILHIIGSMNPVTGGPCQGIRNLNRELEEKGVHREVVSLDDPKALFIGSDPFVIHALGPGRGLWQYSAKLFPWLLSNLNRFDVVVVNGIWLYHVYAAMKALRMLKKKSIEFNSSKKFPRIFIMPHGMLDPYFQKARGRGFKAVRNWIYWRLIESKNIQQASGLLFTCEEELRLARHTFTPYLPKKECNIGYGVPEPAMFTPAMREAFSRSCPYLENRPFLLFLGRIHVKKGVDLLLKAYKEIYGEKKEIHDRESEQPALVIAGPGLGTRYGRRVQHMAASLGIEDAVFFLGMLSGDAKWGAFYSCDAFILPSHQENFGIAVAEALACSKPTLISGRINIWREIKNSNAGFVANDTIQGTIDLLYSWDKIKMEEKKQMQKKARACFERHFAVEAAATRFLNTVKTSFRFIAS